MFSPNRTTQEIPYRSTKSKALWTAQLSSVFCTCPALRRICADFWGLPSDKSRRHYRADDDDQTPASFHRCEPGHTE